MFAVFVTLSDALIPLLLLHTEVPSRDSEQRSARRCQEASDRLSSTRRRVESLNLASRRPCAAELRPERGAGRRPGGRHPVRHHAGPAGAAQGAGGGDGGVRDVRRGAVAGLKSLLVGMSTSPCSYWRAVLGS